MPGPLEPPLHAVRDVVGRALAEDLDPLGDLTAALVPAGVRATARIVARDPGVLAGRLCADEAFHRVDPAIDVAWSLSDGDVLEPGSVIAEVTGSLAPMLTAERTALNFLCHLSGIATLVRTYVDEAATGGDAHVWDTRKTLPGLRALQKAAVRAGGGRNHRGNLSEWVMVKDNHLRGVTIADAVSRAHDLWPGRTVEVEADRLDQVEAAVRAGADAILFDNMTPDEVRAAVELVDRSIGTGRRPVLEASGGITLDSIAAYSGAGVDMISVSRLTQSAPALDIGLDFPS